MSEHAIAVTDANFEAEVLQSELPVLVDFWAEWCNPCRAIAPIVDEVAALYQGKLKVAKVDIDQASDAPMQYGVRSVPTLLLFKNGQVEATQIGSLSLSELKAFIDSHL